MKTDHHRRKKDCKSRIKTFIRGEKIKEIKKESRKEIQGSRAEDCRCQTGC